MPIDSYSIDPYHDPCTVDLATLITEVGLGVYSEWCILTLSGTTLTVHPDYILIRSLNQPSFHWGNYIYLRAIPTTITPYLELFSQEFPQANYLALGLPAIPGAHYPQYPINRSELVVLSTTAPLPLPELPDGFIAREFTNPDDFQQRYTIDMVANEQSGEHNPAEYKLFLQESISADQQLVDSGSAKFWGVFTHDNILVAATGIVVCPGSDDSDPIVDPIARFRPLETLVEYRRQGFASHLMALAARWAHTHNARQLVIVTESTNDAAISLYHKLGFTPAGTIINVYDY